uniref:Phosphoribosylformylglycinamidine synthase n=1 Tax=Plectus sambesii TaxID=2011161 RepID=A0A914UZB2_9BILA
MPILRYFNWPELSEAKRKQLAEEIDNLLGTKDAQVDAEACFHVVLADGTDVRTFDETLGKRLEWLLSKPIGDQRVTKQSRLVQQHGTDGSVIEIGPRLSFTTAFSTNAVSACRSAGLNAVIRLEKSIRYQIITSEPFKDDHRNALIDLLSDRMTEMEYVTPPDSFESQAGRQPIFEIDLMGEHSMDNLKKANMEMGLAFDNDDLNYYHDLFVNHLRRNPTNVELFDLAQSNSDHSRHWFFKGRMVVDGHEQPMSLFQRIQDTQKHSNQNNIIAFNDNSSAIRGFPVTNYISKNPSVPSQLDLQEGIRHLIYTAETHNFPTGVCPFPGAATGTGGRIRDVHATGRGAHEIAGVAGYSFGNLRLPGYVLPWEDEEAPYPHNFAHPRQIAIQASNGASDYGNKFGEPLIAGFARSFGQTSEISGERREWIKPIMFSGGIGAIDDQLTSKLPPTK